MITIKQWFDKLSQNYVDLDSNQVARARASRDWLIDRIHEFCDNGKSFPLLCNKYDINFGSFARKTKIRPLDDIDIIIGLNGEGARYEDKSLTTHIIVDDNYSWLRRYCFDGSNKVSSRKVINAFISRLSAVPQYEKAEASRKREAAVLNLSSYPWAFDIVPGFVTVEISQGENWYLIPDGLGGWKKTDPRIDRDLVTRVNQANHGCVLKMVRLFKYWNHINKKQIPSYLLEAIIVQYFRYSTEISTCLWKEFAHALHYLSRCILHEVNDPKNIQGNINKLSTENRENIAKSCIEHGKLTCVALKYESEGNIGASIKFWEIIFGVKI
jgi:hypothetical protein